MPRIHIEDREHRYILLTEWVKNPHVRITVEEGWNREGKRIDAEWVYPSTHVKCEGSMKKYDPILIPHLGCYQIEFLPESAEGEGVCRAPVVCQLRIEEMSHITHTLSPDYEKQDYSNRHQNQTVKSFIFDVTSSEEAFLRETIQKTIEDYGKNKKDALQIYYNRHSDCWSKLSVLDAVQSVEQIFFPRGVMEGILRDVDRFCESKDRYVRFGRAFKLTFLLKGAPGMGKSTVARAIAHKLHRPLYMLNLASAKCDGDLVELFRDIKPNSVLVIEDMDSFFEGRKPGDTPTGLSFSAIINLLDGSLSSGNGLITFITANNPQHLDKAILRPGRTDRIIHFGDMAREQFDAAWMELVSKEAPPDEELFRICQRNQISMSGLMDIFFNGTTDEERRSLARQSAADRKFGDNGASMYT